MDEALFQLSLEKLSSEIGQNGLSVLPQFVSDEESQMLADEANRLSGLGSFKRAAVGRGRAIVQRDDVRRDHISWWHKPSLTPCQMILWNRLERIREHLNRTLFLGLADLEGHYAVYAPGGFYKRHVDRFRDNDDRVLSIVVYFNQNWQRDEGGQLRFYRTGNDKEIFTDIYPLGGNLVCFLSDRVPHEVCITARTRISFAGWFRRRSI
jgi:SM-20-related protein